MTSSDRRLTRTATVAVAATFALLTLAACGGGGGGTASNGGPSGPDATPTLAEAQIANPGATRNAGAQAAGNLPNFGSVTQSSNGGSVAGVTGDAASASFDGRNVRLTVRRTDGSRIVLDAAIDRIGSENYAPVVPGYSYRGDALLTHTTTSVSVAAVYTNWNNSDPTDYLAGGYWMHLSGRSDPLTITGAEIGAFVDGPEISSAPTLTNLGTATYSGEAGGLYAYGSSMGAEIGEFAAAAALTAKFNANTISGCIGCNGGVFVTGVATGANGQTQTFADVHVPARLRLGAASIGSDGAFRNRDVTLERDDATVTQTSGSWGGRFSNVPTQAGDPRLVAGTAGAEWTESDGGQGVVVGAWFGTRD